MKNNTYAASLSGYIHTTSNQLDAINRTVAKTRSVENLIVENAQFQVDVHGKREIRLVPWGYMSNLVGNINTMVDNLHRFGLQFSFKLYCHIF